MTQRDMTAALRRRGATALTYGLVVGLVGIAALGAVTRVGESQVSLFGEVSSTLTDVIEQTAETNPSISPSPLPSPSPSPSPTPTVVYRLRETGFTSYWAIVRVPSNTTVTTDEQFVALCQTYGLAMAASSENNNNCDEDLASPRIEVTTSCNMFSKFPQATWLDDWPGGQIWVQYADYDSSSYGSGLWNCSSRSAGQTNNGCSSPSHNNNNSMTTSHFIACADQP